ncbi:MAG: DUF2141 domain-containing protein [Winogradskyella arenosi]
MKTTLLTFAFIFMFATGHAQDQGITITVTIDNVPNNNGNVTMALHTEDTFMKANGIMSAKSVISDRKVSLTFNNVKPGTYAIMALHDENLNNRMDFSANGMPLEAYGMSNNDMSMGPPQYDSAKFEVKEDDLSFNIRF